MPRHPIGTAVTFAFSLHRVTLADPEIRRTGAGVVVDDQDYSVPDPPGYTVRVTASPDYPAGEHVHVSRFSLRAAPACHA